MVRRWYRGIVVVGWYGAVKYLWLVGSKKPVTTPTDYRSENQGKISLSLTVAIAKMLWWVAVVLVGGGVTAVVAHAVYPRENRKRRQARR